MLMYFKALVLENKSKSLTMFLKSTSKVKPWTSMQRGNFVWTCLHFAIARICVCFHENLPKCKMYLCVTFLATIKVCQGDVHNMFYDNILKFIAENFCAFKSLFGCNDENI